MEILFPIVGVTVLLVLLGITSRVRYMCIRAIALIPFKLGEWIRRFWVWLSGSGNRASHALATFTIILLLVSILNIAVMTLGDTDLGFSAIWEGNIPTIFRDCQIKGNINIEGERIYHTPQSPYFYKTNIQTFNGERWFCTVEEAETAGWRAPY